MATRKQADPLRATRVVRGMVAIVGTALPLFTGCAMSTRYLNAAHPQYGQTEVDRDWYECRRENTRPKVSSVVVPNVGTYDAGMVVDEDMARSCLAARGWRPVTSSSPQTPPTPATPAPRTSDNALTRSQTPSTPGPDERARTERFQRFARERLAKPYSQAPFACDDGGWWS